VILLHVGRLAPEKRIELLLEAFRSVRVRALREGGVRDTIRMGSTGFRVPPGDPGLFANALLRLVLPVGFASLARAPDHFSFPSGHSAGALAVVLPVAGDLMAEGRVALAAICVVPTLLVGVSRSYLGVHYPGDVVAGWALAIMAALVTHMVLP
jgi:membrane-associated phospholipid phosphatase